MALTDKLTAIAEAIRSKTNEATLMTLEEMPNKIKSIESGSTIEDLTTELTEQNETIITQSSIIEEILKELGILEDLTDEQITALENMIISIENGELVFEYNDDILNIDFNIENENLIVTNDVTGTDFNINNNGELEVSYQ